MSSNRIEEVARRQWARWSNLAPSDQHAIRRAIAHDPEAAADAFYAHLLAHDEARHFLDPELVESRLKASLARWLRGIAAIDSPADLTAQLEVNFHVGKVHSRINVPLHLVSDAFRLIRQRLLDDMPTEGPDRITTERALFLVHWLEPFVEVMNEAYLDDVLDNTRQRQALRSALLGPQLMIELERLKSDVQGWIRRLLVGLVAGRVPTFEFDATDLRQWVVHKGPLIGADEAVLAALLSQVEIVATEARAVLEAPSEHAQRLDTEAARLLRLLDQLVRGASEDDVGVDPLTQVLNRRFMVPVLQREVSLARRFDRVFSVLMVDLDRFKAVNDTHGHPVGDEVLRQTAQVLLANVRPGDFVFRYGGEEFLVVLADTSATIAARRGEAIRRQVAEQSITTDRGPYSPSVSVGVATFLGHPDYQRVVQRADEALLAAKEGGRNGVVSR